MTPSTCDQKKADIVRLAEKECSAETESVKAIYKLKCLEIENKYEVKRLQACRDLKQQELKELTEIKRLHEEEMEPINVKHAEKLSAIREQYRIAAPEADLHAFAIPETLNSPTLVSTAVSPPQKTCSDNDRNNL